MQKNTQNSTRVAAYLRDSGGGEQDLSLPQQEEEIRRWCSANGLLLTRIFRDEAVPGSSTITRNGFNEMIRYFRDGSCTECGIVLWKYSRFARDIDDAQFFRADLRRRGYQIYSIKDTIPDGLNGRFFEAAIDWMNARFLEDLSTDVKRGLHHLVQNYGAMPGKPPVGYIRQPLDLGKRRDGTAHIVSKWVPDPETWERCKTAWEMRARGSNYRQIHEATSLFRSKNSYTHFFRNRVYLGELRYGDLVIKDKIEPMITESTWLTVQAINKQMHASTRPGSASHPRRSKSHFILSGKAYCAKCGAILNGEIIRFRNRPGYEYYACSGVQRNMNCDARKIPRHTLENAVIDTFQEYIMQPDMLTALQNELLNDQDAHNRETIAQLIELERQLANTRRQITNIVDHLADRGPDDQSPTLMNKLNDLEAQSLLINGKIADLDHNSTDHPPILTYDELEKLVIHLKKLLDSENKITQRKILNGFIENISVKRDGKKIVGEIKYRFPPDEEFMPISKCLHGVSYHRHKISTITLNSTITKHPRYD